MEGNATSSSDRSCAKGSTGSLPSLSSISEEMSEQVSRASSSCEPTAPDSSPPSLSAKVQELIDLSRIMSALSAGGNGAYVGAPVESESASSAAQVSARSSTSENLPSITELPTASDAAEFDIISDPAVLQVFNCIPASGALHPKVPTSSEGKCPVSGQTSSPVSPGQINDDPAVLSVLSLPPDRKEPPTVRPIVGMSASSPPARGRRDGARPRRNDRLPPIQVPKPASKTYMYLPSDGGFFSPPYAMPTAPNWSAKPLDGLADQCMPSRMSLYDMDDKFFPPRGNSLIAEEMSRGMNTPPPPLDHHQADRLFVMVNVEEVPLGAADLVYVVEMFDGVRPLIAFALPLGVHNSVFGTHCPERTAPSRLILLLPQGTSWRKDTHRRYQLRVRTFEAVPLNPAAFAQMLLSRPPSPPKQAKLTWNSFSIRPEDTCPDEPSESSGGGATPLNAITASRSLLSERFRFDENYHLVPMQLPNGIKCFLCVDLALHCRRNVLFQVHNHQHHYGEPPRPRYSAPKRHDESKPPPSKPEEQPASA